MAGIDLLQLASREYILGNTTQDDLVSFISDQIKDPFNSGDTNYFKKLVKKVATKDELDELCSQFFTQVQDVYPGLEIDLSEYEQRLSPLFSAVYKFFVKNASTVMYLFIREFIFNNKNRKALVAEFTSSKLATYPKEQYGKKEYYILMTKLHQIVDEIFEDNITLEKLIKYVTRNKCKVCVDQVSEALSRGYIVDNGVVAEMYKLFKKSDGFRAQMNRLEMDINETFILPYLEENGMMGVRIPPSEDIVPEIEDDEEDDDDES
ncbi:MAG: hypothetical protein NC311_06735 [Muribaculaceae bacterium]|nr:hypothetical protein [Muribaculaceae bacterium]